MSFEIYIELRKNSRTNTKKYFLILYINITMAPLFKDHPEFTPTLTPKQMFNEGIFAGTYFRDISSTITSKKYTGSKVVKEFPKSWFLFDNTSSVKDLTKNKHGVWSGSSLTEWESKGWIRKQDPYGWVQWYCRFYKGRRTPDDKRQIQRWSNIASKDKGRFMRRKNKSPVVKQLLLQWAMLV
jgi:hypothetical protein